MLENEFTARGLQEGKEYEFRVAACNKAGVGKWSETEQAIEARAPDCKKKVFKDLWIYINNNCIFKRCTESFGFLQWKQRDNSESGRDTQNPCSVLKFS